MITILHLYPRELGINGDVGNVMALVKRAQWRGMSARVVDHEVGAALPETVHLVHIGSGPVSAQELVRKDLDRIAPRLREWAVADVPFLAIAGGWQLLGRELIHQDGSRTSGVGIFPSTARLVSERAVGEVVGEADIAGFENHGAVTTLLEDAAPLTRTVHGHGNAAGSGPKRGAQEGVVAGASIATNLHGPFLPMNPRFADVLLERAALLAGDSLGNDDGRCEMADGYAARSRRAIRDRLGISPASVR
ncbi:MAG: cobyric acid synthase [Acidobacteria bacterium]|nr:cobyric acid synthase [Acidobacteriota bacterium]